MPFRPLLLASALALGLATTAAHAQSTTDAAPVASRDGTLLRVSAQAEASRTPDVATLSTGVVSQAADANAAMRANSAQMEKVMAAIRGAGIAARDIQTSGINLNPQYRYAENEPPVITGYQASNTVSIKVRDLARLGDAIGALVAGGANQINGPTFEIDQPEGVYDEARRAALDKARKRADMYAEALGLRVRRIVSVSDGGSGFRPLERIQVTGTRMMAADAASAPVSPGESTLSATLEVVFELGR